MRKKVNVWVIPILVSLGIVLGIYLGYTLPQPRYRETGDSAIVYDYQSRDLIHSVMDLIEWSYVDSVDMDEIMVNTVHSLLAQLDPHSYYVPPIEKLQFNEDMSGAFEGIGIEFNVLNDTIIVVSVIPGGPSESVGLMAGDRIVMIGDEKVAGTGISRSDVVTKLRGKKDTRVELGISRFGSTELIDFSINRDKIPVYTVDASYMLNKDKGYIKLNRFGEKSLEEMREALAMLKREGMRDLILDLRGNPGGYLSAAVGIADLFLEKGKLITYTEGRSRPRVHYRSRKKDQLSDGRLVVLIDENSASASEIIAGAIQDNDRGIIIGRRSYGKGLVQEVMNLDDGGALNISVSRYYTPSGRCIQKPYDNRLSHYYEEAYEEMMSGKASSELNEEIDTNQYFTSEGRRVYGGGGILPDLLMPLDTSGYTEWLRVAINQGYLIEFSILWADQNRARLEKTFKKPEYFAVDKSIGERVHSEFINYVSKRGYVPEKHEVLKSRTVLTHRLKSGIARNIWGNKGYYVVMNTMDPYIKRGIEELP
jgi:carboxyl-terminal processing protease